MTGKLNRSGKQQFWEKHIAQWGGSGLSQVEYCHKNKIGLKAFQYWKRKSKRKDTSPALVEIPLSKNSMSPILQTHALLCLHIGQHYRVEIRKGFDPEDLARVVRVLGRI